MAQDITAHDSRERRCPMLGHQVRFGYCRAPGAQLPCRRIFDCWWQTFDVEGFLRGHFSDDDVRKITSPPAHKIASLVDLIEKARKASRPPE